MHHNWNQETQSLETILDYLRFAFSRANEAELYYGHGTDNAWDDMRSLILRSLHLPHDAHPQLLQSRLTPAEKTLLTQQIQKRIAQHIPVPYLIKEAYFCDLPFYVDQRVLIPRSPVAELIENQFAPWIDADSVHTILDVCTGSACIAIACCYAFPEAVVDASDISSDALEVAKINQKKHKVEEQLTLMQSDCFAAIPEKQYDVIISNPPYVGSAEMQTLPKEYQHEPVLALEAENNGLAIVDKILHNAARYLTDKGILIVEVGNSEDLVAKTYPQLPFTWLSFENGGEGVFLLTKEQLINSLAD